MPTTGFPSSQQTAGRLLFTRGMGILATFQGYINRALGGLVDE
jgi:hypothetical protein